MYFKYDFAYSVNIGGVSLGSEGFGDIRVV